MIATKGDYLVVGWWSWGGAGGGRVGGRRRAYLMFSFFEQKLSATVHACEHRLTSTCKAASSGTVGLRRERTAKPRFRLRTFLRSARSSRLNSNGP